MDRQRAAGLLLALAACFATATAAPTSSNHTALDLYNGSPDGCFYNFQHYGEGNRIMTNEPCLNCTCHNRMLMCYLRVCPFTKPIGQDCTIEKRADQCCPIVTCPDVPVDLLTSTTTSPAEYGPTGIGKLDKYGCSINGKYFQEGSKVPPTPNKPCESCYCIRNMTTCVMQECTLHVDGCTPIYHKDVCCPVRYSCDHPEDEMPLLDDLSTTVRPTPGFLLTTTTISPVTQMSQDCVYDNRIFPDGALIKTEKACDHCYCMKGDIVCVVQECGTPMENEGKNCTALLPREGVCCPDTYICEGDEVPNGTYEPEDFTTSVGQDKLTTLLPPRRTSSEGSGYRNEPDEVSYTVSPEPESEIEGSGEDVEQKPLTDKPALESSDDIQTITEDAHEYILLTTTNPREDDEISTKDKSTLTVDNEITTEPQQHLTSTTEYSSKDSEESITDEIQMEDVGSGELPEDVATVPHKEISEMPNKLVTEENVATTEINKSDTGIPESDSIESQMPVTVLPLVNEGNAEKSPEDNIIKEISDMTTVILPTESSKTTDAAPVFEEYTKSPDFTVSNEEVTVTDIPNPVVLTTLITPVTSDDKKDATTESAGQNVSTKDSVTLDAQHYPASTEVPSLDDKSPDFTVSNEEIPVTDIANPVVLTTLRTPVISDDKKDATTESAVQNVYTKDSVTLDAQHYPASTEVPSLDDEFVTTESYELDNDEIKKEEHFVPQHVTASTPMLEEIEKDTTEYIEPGRIVTAGASQDDQFNNLDITTSKVLITEDDKKHFSGSPPAEENIPEYLPGTTDLPMFDQHEVTEKVSEVPSNTNDKEILAPEQTTTTSSEVSDIEIKTTPDLGIIASESDREQPESTSRATTVALEIEEFTTEPDKGLNTIPSDKLDEEIAVSPEVHKSTIAEDHVTMKDDNNSELSSTISDTSVSREEVPLLTTESAFRKEDYRPTETQISHKLTTEATGVTEEVIISTLAHDLPMSTGSDTNLHHGEVTTLEPKHTESIEVTTLAKEILEASSYETTTSEAIVSPIDLSVEKATTTLPLYDKGTTIANEEDNEILNEPRIPGEGDCLLNGVTYTNESAVPSSNKCQSDCRCVSSIIKCDPIICSPPPEYMDNCVTMYDTPDACCPTFICDHKTETIPPQSHNQMSGTEAPVVSPVHCQGSECEISTDKKDQHEYSEDCKSGSCGSSSDKFEKPIDYNNAENIPEHSATFQKEGCVGDECTQGLCSGKNCEAAPVQPCEDGKCESESQTVLPPKTQECANGENCAVSNIPAKDCKGDNCDGISNELEVTYPKETCTKEGGCPSAPKLPEEECKEDHCRRKDSSLQDHQVSEPCSEPDCKQPQTNFESSTTSLLEQTSQGINDNDKKDIEISESTEKVAITTEPLEHVEISKHPESQDIVTKQPDEAMTVVSDEIELATKSEAETTTKIAEFTNEQEIIGVNVVTEKNERLATKSPEDQSPFATETSGKKDSTGYTSSSSENLETEMTDKSILQVETTAITSEKPISEAEKTPDVTEPSKIEMTESGEKLQSNHEIHAITESTKPETTESHDVDIEKDKIGPDTSLEGTTDEPSTSIDDVKKLDTVEQEDTTMPFIQENSTEPSKTTAESQKTTGLLEEAQTSTALKDNEFTERTTLSASESTITYTEKLVEQSDYTTSEPTIHETSISSGKPDVPNITGTPKDTEHESTTEINEESKPTESSIEPDVPHLQPETEHKDTSMIIQETGTEPSKMFNTESSDITKYTEKYSYDTTTQKVSENPSTDSIIYTKEQQENTSPESDKTTAKLDENVTVPSNIQTESQPDIKSPEVTEHDETTTAVIVDTPESTPLSTGYIYEEATTKISEEYSTAPSKYETGIELTTQTSDILEESPETSILTHQVSEHDKNTTPEIPEKSSTKPTYIYSTEKQQEDETDEIKQKSTTDQIPQEMTTEPYKLFDISKSSEGTTQEDTTSKSSEITEPPVSYTTDSQDSSKVPKESTVTTTKEVTEETSEPTKTVEDANPFKPDIDGPIEEPDITKYTTSTQESVGFTTSLPISDSKITHPEIAESTDTVLSDSESKLPHAEVTEPTKPITIDNDVSSTATPSDKTQSETNKSELETHTTLLPAAEFEVSQALTTQKPSEYDVTQKTDTEISTETNEPKTTQQEINLTTPTPTVTSQSTPNTEVKTENPYTSYTEPQEQSTGNLVAVTQEDLTEEILAGTETPSEVKTGKPSPHDTDISEETGSGTLTSPQISLDGKPATEESFTEEPISKYSSPEPPTEYDSTKTYIDENTIEHQYHDSKEPENPVDDLTQSLVTEQYETDKEPPKFEEDSQTHRPIPSVTLDVSRLPGHETKEDLSTPSSVYVDTTTKELEDKAVTFTEYDQSTVEIIRTESPSHIDELTSDTTTSKKDEDTMITKEPSATEQNEVITSTIAEHKITTKDSDEPLIDKTTEAITLVELLTEKAGLGSTHKPSVDLHKTQTEVTYTTETPDIIEHTESVLDVSTLLEVQTQTETYVTISSEPQTTADTNIQTSKPVSKETSVDEKTTEISEPSRKQSESTTFNPSTEIETSSPFKPTIAHKLEESSSPSGPSYDTGYTDKIKESTVTLFAEDFTTENAPSEGFTDKQSEILQTVSTENVTPVEDFVTTKKQLEPELYQTTVPAIEDTKEISTRSSISLDEGLTTLTQDIEHGLPIEEQPVPVVISDTDKTSTPSEFIAVQTERVIPASEKPIQETTAPEEEFIVATTKATTLKTEEETSTSSPTSEKTGTPSEANVESYTTAAPDTTETIVRETPEANPEKSATTSSEAPVTVVPEKTGTSPETPVVENEAPVTEVPETPATVEQQTPLSSEPEEPVTKVPEVPITSTPVLPQTTATESSATNTPELLNTAAPEAPATRAPEVPKTTASIEPYSNAPELPSSAASFAPVTNAHELPASPTPEAPITSAPELPITAATEAQITKAPELPVTTAPELPKPVSTEAQPTDEALTPEEEGSFPPSGGTSGYGQEPDYVEEDQTFGPGTCRYGGKVYVSAQQIPRDDPCDFCFCFRSDIICLQQSCPPPIHGCHEEPIQGFCCPRYECPVSMATTVNVTTTTTTTTTTLPPNFPTHSYKGSVQKRGCQIKGQTYKVGEVVRASSGPCLHCTCGGDGQMKCDPKVCTPEPMLRQMIAAAVSAKRRR